MMTLEELRKRLAGRLHAADIGELCRMAEGREGDGMKAALFCLAGDGDRRVASNALWVFSRFRAPERRWLQARQEELVDMAIAAPDVTIRRLVLTLLEHQTFAADAIRTDFLDVCLGRMLSDDEPVSIRSLSMKLAYRMCRHYPELLEELRMSIAMIDAAAAGSAGLRSCRRNVLRQMEKAGKGRG
ncbi:MAG: hypothetical protein Q4E71_03760 [Prevotella sp.]|nr:hypothetical protein [Prevotella sp.]